MVIDDALRVTGGARGVVEGDGVPLVFRELPDKIRVTFLEEGFVILFAERFTAGEFGVQRIDDQRLWPFEQRQSRFDDGGKFRIGNQHLGFAVRQHEGNGFGIETGVQRIQHGTDHRHAEMTLKHGCRIGQHHGHRIPLADAATLKGGGQLTATVVGFLPGVLAAPLDHGNALRINEGRALEKAQRGKRNVVGRILLQTDGIRVCHKYLLTILAKVLFSFWDFSY